MAAGVMDAVVVRGTVLHVHPPGEFVSDEMRRDGDFYEADILDEIVRRLATVPPGILIDVGAMIGTHTVFLATFAKYMRIHAFEPCPENLNLLRTNTDGWSEIHIHDCALSDKRGTLDMGVSAANMGHCVALTTDFWLDEYDRTFSVDAAPLDDYAFEDVRLIKVDAEGHEKQVIEGARGTIERCHPLILIEDWRQEYGPLLPGYRVAADWPAHQAFLYAWAE